MRGAIVVTSLVIAFILGVVASELVRGREPAKEIQAELGSELSGIALIAGALQKLDAGEPAAAVRLLELGLSQKAERAATLAGQEPSLDCTMIPNLRHGVHRALTYAETHPLEPATVASLRALHALCGPLQPNG
jgi:hypothetical protein